MAKWEQLIAARECKHFSQLEAAERVNVGIVTYQRWESGKSKPQPQHMRQLYEVFGSLLDLHNVMRSHEPISDPSHTPPLEEMSSVVSAGEIDEAQAFIATHMTTHLWSLVFLEHPTHDYKRDVIRQAIEEFDTMNTNNKNYQMTRREALCSLATLPLITFGLTTSEKALQPAQYGSILAQCTASLEACWQLYQDGDASDTSLAFKSVSKYLPVLQSIMRDSSQYRKEATDLAARYALLKTLLGWICVNPTETLQYAKNAVALCKETGDISLQLSAYSKLAWGYFYDKQYSSALKTAQKAEGLFRQHSQMSDTQPFHPVVQSGIYSALALMLAKNGRTPDMALGKATEVDPGDKPYALMTSKRSTLLLEAGWTYCYYGDQTKTIETLQQRIDPETLSPKMPQSAMGRVETINIMALSSLKTKERDIERTIHFWVAGIEGAKTLQNQQRFNEALTTYEFMEVVWPGDVRIKALRDYIVHWE
ncbi:MAG TPA: helix-turn-helix transcriptional regulator [Ktedonobacteraceae bacterium]|nr:helix-turn-helix transcriptional regulator [Ktedonobacteraceae bacterium]